MEPQANLPSARRLERLPTVMARTGLHRSFLYRLAKDGQFPAPVKVGGASCWDSWAIDAWIATQIKNQLEAGDVGR